MSSDLLTDSTLTPAEIRRAVLDELAPMLPVFAALTQLHEHCRHSLPDHALMAEVHEINRLMDEAGGVD